MPQDPKQLSLFLQLHEGVDSYIYLFKKEGEMIIFLTYLYTDASNEEFYVYACRDGISQIFGLFKKQERWFKTGHGK